MVPQIKLAYLLLTVNLKLHLKGILRTLELFTCESAPTLLFAPLLLNYFVHNLPTGLLYRGFVTHTLLQLGCSLTLASDHPTTKPVLSSYCYFLDLLDDCIFFPHLAQYIPVFSVSLYVSCCYKYHIVSSTEVLCS